MKFRHQFSKLNRKTREWIDHADKQVAIELLSNAETRPQYAYLHDVLKDCMSEWGIETGTSMTQGRIEFFLAVYVIYGRSAEEYLSGWRRAYWSAKKRPQPPLVEPGKDPF